MIDYDDFDEYPYDEADTTFYVKMKALKTATSKAVLAILEDGSEEWFPKSQITKMTPQGFCIPQWLAEEKNLCE